MTAAGEADGGGEVVLVVLAAGAGRRLGGVAKALLRAPGPGGPAGASFLARVAALGRAGGAAGGLVVVGPPHGDAIRAEAEKLNLSVIDNPAALESGMAGSVARGFAGAARLFPRARAALLWPVDHARVGPETLARLVAEARADRIVVPVHGGRGGHPTAVGRHIWSEMAGCADLPAGALSVVRADPGRVVRIDAGDAGVVADVDRPEDLDAARAEPPAEDAP